MKKIAYSFLFILILFGCKKDKWTPNYVYLHYIDANGNDLFNYSTNGYINDSVRMYYFKNGIKTSYPLPPKDQYPLGYFSDILSSTLLTTDYYEDDVINNFSTNIIHLKAGVDDTLRLKLTGNQVNGSYYTEVWYNGVHLPDPTGSQFAYTVRK